MSSTLSRISLPSSAAISVPSPYHLRLTCSAANWRPIRSGARHRRIASSTQRATERLSTSRCIRSSAFPFRNRASSARSSSLTGPLPSPRSRRALAHQLPSVPSLTPNSRATRAIGLPVSNTSRTAPCRKSSSNFRYLPIAPPFAAMSPRYGGKPRSGHERARDPGVLSQPPTRTSGTRRPGHPCSAQLQVWPPAQDFVRWPLREVLSIEGLGRLEEDLATYSRA